MIVQRWLAIFILISPIAVMITLTYVDRRTRSIYQIKWIPTVKQNKPYSWHDGSCVANISWRKILKQIWALSIVCISSFHFEAWTEPWSLKSVPSIRSLAGPWNCELNRATTNGSHQLSKALTASSSPGWPDSIAEGWPWLERTWRFSENCSRTQEATR